MEKEERNEDVYKLEKEQHSTLSEDRDNKHRSHSDTIAARSRDRSKDRWQRNYSQNYGDGSDRVKRPRFTEVKLENRSSDSHGRRTTTYEMEDDFRSGKSSREKWESNASNKYRYIPDVRSHIHTSHRSYSERFRESPDEKFGPHPWMDAPSHSSTSSRRSHARLSISRNSEDRPRKGVEQDEDRWKHDMYSADAQDENPTTESDYVKQAEALLATL